MSSDGFNGAKRRDLERLHELLTSTYCKVLETAVQPVVGDDGEVRDEVVLSPAMLTSISQFLRQNDVVAPLEATDHGKKLKDILEQQAAVREKLRVVGDA